ncbi:Arsenate reductase [Usitatibacter rugosus]|uniref:Arsenate reductase n=1 Tax=Usitatibacter rugosus TaxID=2732067 RepID=A0A6M4GUA3_9PROT|nr:arsenate reductase ArsC [Usitatibacter rugosus]QJR10726.1 Arsenate reductase [Usitatibacter rugosus]
MSEKPCDVLFLCTGNSARSIMAEVMLNALGKGRFRGHSAGSQPKGQVHPMSLETMRALGFPTSNVRSKSWDEFAVPGAPPLDFIITVCDNAATEVCPIWPGKPTSAHWGVPDPAAVEGTVEEQRAAFHDAALALRRRIELMTSLPLAKLDHLSLQSKLHDIGTQ